MGPGTLAARAQTARDRIAAAAHELSKRFHIEADDPPFRPPVRDPQTRAMLAQEDAADLLERLVAATSPTAEIPTNVEVAEGHTAAELRDIIAAAGTHEELERLEDAESKGSGRKTV